MNDTPSPPPTNGPRPSGLVRDTLFLAAAGIVLGLAANQFRLMTHDPKALSWVRVERKLVSLDDVMPKPVVVGDTTSQSGTVLTSAPAETPPPAVSSAPKPEPHAATPAPTPAASESPKPAAPPTAAVTPPPATPPAATATDLAPSSATPAANAKPRAWTPPGAAAPAGPAVPDSKEPIEAHSAFVKQLYDAKSALFLDARSAEEFAEGHIPGAKNLPFDDVFKNPDRLKGLGPLDRPIVTYCGGGDCDLSKSLAFSLVDAGYRKVLVFMDGVPGWKNSGNALSTGGQP